LIKARPEVEKVEENTVTFINGERQKVDVIIIATGYTPAAPFLSTDLFPREY